MRSTARATSPSAEPNGATVAISAWAIAASTRAGVSSRLVSRSAS